MKLKSINKRGDISITILVIGVFSVCTLAIVSFMIYKAQNKNNSVNMEIFENLSSAVEKYYFYINSGLSPSVAAANVGGQINGDQLILNSQQGSDKNPIISIKYIINLNG
jgi:hypothetical protein